VIAFADGGDAFCDRHGKPRPLLFPELTLPPGSAVFAGYDPGLPGAPS
jgi:hypothetical protein